MTIVELILIAAIVCIVWATFTTRSPNQPPESNPQSCLKRLILLQNTLEKLDIRPGEVASHTPSERISWLIGLGLLPPDFIAEGRRNHCRYEVDGAPGHWIVACALHGTPGPDFNRTEVEFNQRQRETRRALFLFAIVIASLLILWHVLPWSPARVLAGVTFLVSFLIGLGHLLAGIGGIAFWNRGFTVDDVLFYQSKGLSIDVMHSTFVTFIAVSGFWWALQGLHLMGFNRFGFPTRFCHAYLIGFPVAFLVSLNAVPEAPGLARAIIILFGIFQTIMTWQDFATFRAMSGNPAPEPPSLDH